MHELDKARLIEAPEKVRVKAVNQFRTQLAEWGIAVPDTSPLVLDFGLGRFPSIGLTEIWIANEIAAGYCGKYLFVANHQTCPMHYHRHKHETFFVMQGRVRVVHDGQEVEIGKGEILAVPSLTRHCFTATGIGPALLLELSQPCVIDDNYFENTRIPIGGNCEKPV